MKSIPTLSKKLKTKASTINMDAKTKKFYLDNSFVITTPHGLAELRQITEYRTGRFLILETSQPDYFNLFASSLLMFKMLDQFAINLATIQSHFDRVAINEDDLVYRLIEAMVSDVISLQDIATEGLDVVADRNHKRNAK